MNYKALFLIATMLSMLALVPLNSAYAMTVPNPTQFTILDLGGPQTLDPCAAYDTASSEILFNVLPSLCFFDFTDTSRYVPWLSDWWPGYDTIAGHGIDPSPPRQWTFVNASIVNPLDPTEPVLSHWARSDKVDTIDYRLGERTGSDITFKFVPCPVGAPIYSWFNLTNFNPASPLGSVWGDVPSDHSHNWTLNSWEDNGDHIVDFCDFIDADCSNGVHALYHVETLTVDLSGQYTITLKSANTASFHVTVQVIGNTYKLIATPDFIEETWYFHINPNYPWQGTGYGNVLPSDMEYTIERGMVMDISGGPQWMFYGALLGTGTSRSGAYNIPKYAHYNALYPDDTGILGWSIDNAIESNSSWVWFNLVGPYIPFQQILCQTWGAALNEQWCINLPADVNGAKNWNASWHVTPGDYNSWIAFNKPKVPGPLGFATQSLSTPKFIGCGSYYLDFVDSSTGYFRLKSFASAGGTDWSKPHIDTVIHEVVTEFADRKARFLSDDPSTQADMIAIERLYTTDPDLLTAIGDGRVRYMKDLPTLSADALFFAYDILNPDIAAFVPKLGGVANKTLLSDRYMRLGLIYSFNVTDYIKTDFLGEALPLHDPIIYGIAYCNDTKQATMFYNINIDKARYCFRMAWGGFDPTPWDLGKYDTDPHPGDEVPGKAWTQGFEIPIEAFPNGPIREDVVLSIKLVVEEIVAPGIGTIDNQPLSWSTGLTDMYNGELGAFMLGWIVDFPDPHDWDIPFMATYGDFSGFQNIHYGDGTLNWNSKGDIKGFPYTNYKGDTIYSINNTYVDGLIDAGIGITNPADRQKLYTEEEDIFWAEAGTEMIEQPSARHYERTWVQGWFYSAIYYGLMFYGPGTAMRLWKADPATIPRNVSVTVWMQVGGSGWHKYVKITNWGAVPELIDFNETVYVNGLPVENEYIEVWLLGGGGQYSKTASGTDVGTTTVSITIERSHSFPTPVGVTFYEGFHLGDLGGGSPVPKFFAFDGACNAQDIPLFLQAYRHTAPAYAMYLGDLGGGSPVPHFFAFDGLCNQQDVPLFLQAYRGTGP